jgi:hypothetical protein
MATRGFPGLGAIGLNNTLALQPSKHILPYSALHRLAHIFAFMLCGLKDLNPNFGA